MHRRPSSRPSSWLAVLASLAYVLGGLLAHAHHTGVEHAVCAEHGELEHVRDVVVADAAHECRGPCVHPEEPTEEGAHEHCVTPLGRLELARLDASSVVVTRPAAASPARNFTGCAPRSRDLLAFAPKQSPPS